MIPFHVLRKTSPVIDAWLARLEAQAQERRAAQEACAKTHAEGVACPRCAPEAIVVHLADTGRGLSRPGVLDRILAAQIRQAPCPYALARAAKAVLTGDERAEPGRTSA